jgi:hypothetical protein
MTKETISKAPAGRPKRIPVGSRNRLDVIGKDPNFVYRIVNDVDDRVERFKQAGYELVDVSESRLSSQRVGTGTPEGTMASMPVGMGTTGYLMKIPKEWYEEDQRLKQVQIDTSEESIKKPNIDGAYGEIKIS